MAAGMEIHSFIKIGNFFLVSGLVVLMLSMVLAVQVEVNDLIHLPPRPSEIRNFHLGECGTAVVAESCQKAFSEIMATKMKMLMMMIRSLTNVADNFWAMEKVATIFGHLMISGDTLK